MYNYSQFRSIMSKAAETFLYKYFCNMHFDLGREILKREIVGSKNVWLYLKIIKEFSKGIVPFCTPLAMYESLNWCRSWLALLIFSHWSGIKLYISVALIPFKTEMSRNVSYGYE